MGLEAVRAAFNQSYRLGEKHAARVLLLHMAFTVTDRTQGDRPAMTYFAGWQTAAGGLGYVLDELDDEERAKAAQAAVKRALRALEAAGLITRMRRSSPGKTAEWKLTLDPIDTNSRQRPRSERGGRRPSGTRDEDRPNSDEDRPVHGTVTVLNSGRSPSPLSEGPELPAMTTTHLDAHARKSSRVLLGGGS
ncbi:hypothetical protein [Amnibacterium setariae]|uniref:Uncharacterized protein n=1 Tax=Amnibacterium setariae TaxID=2306585 RepID=A0A3A1TZM2_9MICO|nr:hypothetical protein [Amnibacterium setariae]RIX26470.1 hypothetical protein D1781_16170 [Amnibacterium setariae]